MNFFDSSVFSMDVTWKVIIRLVNGARTTATILTLSQGTDNARQLHIIISYYLMINKIFYSFALHRLPIHDYEK